MFNFQLRSALPILLFVVTGCAGTTNIGHGSDELLDFAESNCFFWYFKSKNYDLSDIKKVTSGIVEMGSYSAEKFQKTAFLVKDYTPIILSKNNIDVQLAKCFVLKEDKEFLEKLDRIRKL